MGYNMGSMQNMRENRYIYDFETAHPSSSTGIIFKSY